MTRHKTAAPTLFVRLDRHKKHPKRCPVKSSMAVTISVASTGLAEGRLSCPRFLRARVTPPRKTALVGCYEPPFESSANGHNLRPRLHQTEIKRPVNTPAR